MVTLISRSISAVYVYIRATHILELGVIDGANLEGKVAVFLLCPHHDNLIINHLQTPNHTHQLRICTHTRICMTQVAHIKQ